MTGEMERLCYVDRYYGGVIVAYFTDKPLTGEDKVWGDDWNDAPYEHNAGRPYDWTTRLLAMDVPATDPSYMQTNSPWSVEDINEGAVPWLTADHALDDGGLRLQLRAGATPDEFSAFVRALGGTVYAEQATEAAPGATPNHSEGAGQ